MIRLLKFAPTLLAVLFLAVSTVAAEDEKGWISLFDGKTLDGWKIAENPKAFSVKDGVIVVNGTRGHMFYDGKVADHNFKNFELKVEVMTTPGSNSGIYFHTKYQEKDWPAIGYEVQVNQTHKDPKKTSGLYGVKDVMEAPVKDGEWYTQEIIVKGKQIITKVNGKTLVDYTEPDKVEGGRKLSSGTFAIQAHDPDSKVLIKSIKVKVLED